MDQTSIYLLLAWITIVCARPQESEDPRTQCTSYYPGKAILGLEGIKESLQIDTETENLWKTEHLTYK
jgi:hypothetical protein